MKQSFLTEDIEQETIEGMPIGEEAYTLSWAMYADENGALWVNGNYPPYSTPGGTVKMKIKRTSDGVIVYKSSIADERYSRGGSSFVGQFNALPVELQ